ncbi:MAG: porin family protein [Candidatus Krumholzibacteria bacterium]|nr:porin family protein [Candidatus Krumholzibacteria bacterium]
MTRTLVLALCLVAVTAAAVTTPAMAGVYPQSRTGFFIGFGLGWGNAAAKLGQSPDPDRANSVSGNLRFGWSVAQTVAIGLEASSWAKNYDVEGTNLDLNLTGTVTTFAVTYFPGNMGLFLRGGLGFSTASVKLQGGGASFEEVETGAGFLAAAGYEWRLTEKFALGPQAQWAYLKIDQEGLDSVDFVSITAQATWYW